MDKRFVKEIVTTEGYEMAIACICDNDVKRRIEESIEAKIITFGNYFDCVTIDYRLVNILREIMPREVKYAAAIISVPGISDVCGGVCGKLWGEISSADGKLTELEDGVFGFAIPGEISVVSWQTREDIKELYYLACDDSVCIAERITAISQQTYEKKIQSIIASDGCSPCGGYLGVSDKSGKTLIHIGRKNEC